MKKEALSIAIIKILLAILLFTGMGTIIIGGGYIIWKYSKCVTNNQITKPINQETENYYGVLEKKCNDNSCCLASLRVMRENNYKEANENSKCPEGFNGNMMRCITSYQWCEPMEENCAEAGEFVNPDNLKGKTNYPDVCCPGLLKKLGAYKINDNGKCERIIGNPFLTCMPCGNRVCQTINNFEENKCNCPEDCGEEKNTLDEQKFYCEKDNDCLATCSSPGCYNENWYKTVIRGDCEMAITHSCRCIENDCIKQPLLKEDIEGEIRKSNYCDTKNDCIRANDSCSLGCDVVVNRNKVERINKLIDIIKGKCLADCGDVETDLACVNNKCMVLR